MSNDRSVVVPLRDGGGGTLCVGQTRVTLDTVIHAFSMGATPEEIVHRYSSLGLADVYAIISYYLQNRADVESYLAQRHADAEAVQRAIEGELDPQGIRDRLLARRPVAPLEPGP